ncbi:MAG: Hsp20/alpha crystallin family protein [Candidatus Scalinduaceae bacterium]
MSSDLTKWPQWPTFTSLQKEMNRLFEDFFGREDALHARHYPLLDVSETNDNIIVKAELPGVDPKAVDISIAGDNLTIRGEKKEEKEEKGKHFHRIERSSGSFSRTINLPASVDSNKVQAEYKDGILKINLPKKEETKAKKIEVKVK